MDISTAGLGILAVLVLVFANGFFVAAEFALVTVRKTRIDQMIAEGHRGARTVRRALNDPDSYIAATQLGITMASLALGWVGMTVGTYFRLPALALLPGAHVRIAFAEAWATFVLAAVALRPRPVLRGCR